MNTIEFSNRLAGYKDELARLKACLDLAFGAGVKNNLTKKEDRVVFPLGVASRDLCEEVIWFVHQGFGAAALRTARTLYECVVFSLYINKHPQTWKRYLDTLHAQWAMILRNLPGADKAVPEMHKAISEKVPNYAKANRIPLAWNSDRKTHRMALNVGIRIEFHCLAFSYTSAFVHPSVMFLLNNLAQSSPGGALVTGAKPQDEQSRMALQIAHDMIINAVRLRVKYSGASALRESLKVCEEDFFRIWEYRPQLTPRRHGKR